MILNLNYLINKYNMNIRGVLHIGAHHGEEHIIYKNNNINNIVYFEPLKSNFEILKNKGCFLLIVKISTPGMASICPA